MNISFTENHESLLSIISILLKIEIQSIDCKVVKHLGCKAEEICYNVDKKSR